MDPAPSSPPRSPRKRLRLEDGAAVSVEETPEQNVKAAQPISMDVSHEQSAQEQRLRESKVGICEHVSPSVSGFEGLLKKRYTDFIVNEILPNGTVVHLNSLRAPGLAKTNRREKPAAKSDEVATEATEPVKPLESNDTVQDVPKEVPTKEAPQEVPTKEEPKEVPTKNPTQDAAAENGAGESNEIATTISPGAEAWQNYAGKHKGFVLSAGDRETLQSFLSPSETDEVLALFNRVLESPHRKPSQYGTVRSTQTIDRASRTDLHQTVRRVFASRLESYTEPDGTFVIAAASGASFSGNQNRDSRRGQNRGRGPQMSQKQKFAELGGDFVHFSLYKENKDTMEVITYMARQIQVQPKAFQFAGTKDRRAVTVQQVSAYRTNANNLANLNSRLRNAQIGNFTYKPNGLALGELSGNEFVITLRECSFPGTDGLSVEEKIQAAGGIVRVAMNHLVENGFINYYGMQRFGTFMTRTDTIGTKLLQGDYKGAVDLLLQYDPGALEAAEAGPGNDTAYTSDDKARALGISIFRATDRANDALEKIPRKFSGETNVIRFLGGPKNKNNFFGAMMSIPRNLRMMYIHAYQSLVWNHAASHRWATGGATILEGDLVLVNEHKDKEEGHEAVEKEELDADGEPVVRPGRDDRAILDGERFERARALTKEEVDSGKYNIYDVVLPSPGYDVLYPAYMVQFYEELMAKEEFGELDPHNMHRSNRDFSLSGHYRKLLARPHGPYGCRVVAYAQENEQFVQTDLERLNEAQKLERAKAAAQRKLQSTGSSSNASANASANTNADKEESEAGKMDYTTGMDGAAESKIRAVRDSLLGTGGHAEAGGPAGQEAADTPMHGVDGVDVEENAKGNDAMDTAPAEEQQPNTAAVRDSLPPKDKLAVILTLQLGTSTYATMALRELAKGGICPYKPEYGGGR